MKKAMERLKMKMGVLLVLLPLCLAAEAQGASFDCEKAGTAVEKLICADAELSKLDEEMTAAYKTALQDEKQPDSVRQTQKKWLKERNNCPAVDAGCVKRAYETRLHILSSPAAAIPTDTGTEHQQDAALPNEKTGRFNFELTKGQGVMVCEAYLERLSKSDFTNPPFCGRPEEERVQGFTRLHRVPLTAEEIHGLYPKISGFQSSQNQNQWQIQLKNSLDKEVIPLASIRSDMGMNRIGAWRYDPPVDIDNDGQSDNILMWHEGSCGTIDGSETYPAHGAYTANILDAQNQFIDETRTRELFGHPLGWLEIKAQGFRYLGITMGIFAYQGIYYFDTFFERSWGDYEGHRRKSEEMAWTLAVFLRKDGKTRQVCEYYWTNWQSLEIGRATK